MPVGRDAGFSRESPNVAPSMTIGDSERLNSSTHSGASGFGLNITSLMTTIPASMLGGGVGGFVSFGGLVGRPGVGARHVSAGRRVSLR